MPAAPFHRLYCRRSAVLPQGDISVQTATSILLGIREAPTLTASSERYQQEHYILTKKISLSLKVQHVLDWLEKTLRSHPISL